MGSFQFLQKSQFLNFMLEFKKKKAPLKPPEELGPEPTPKTKSAKSRLKKKATTKNLQLSERRKTKLTNGDI